MTAALKGQIEALIHQYAQGPLPAFDPMEFADAITDSLAEHWGTLPSGAKAVMIGVAACLVRAHLDADSSAAKLVAGYPSTPGGAQPERPGGD